MIQVRRLGHASFSTPDLDGQVGYYADVLGLRVIERGKDRAFLACRSGLEAIALERGEAVALRRLSFQVAPGSDLAALARELSALGIRCERRSGISPGIAEALVFADIKGTLIELFADYAFAADDGAQAVITPLKLGHVAYRVTDVQQVTKFYTDVLGFRVSDWRDTTFAFLRCNTDHHTVNFVVDPVPQLHHIAFEVKDWPEIHRACDFLARNNIRLVWGPARHIIGHNIAAYHRNADNVRVELFCEMDQMKDEALGYFDPRPWHQDRPQRPKVWDKDTLRNYWGFASHGTFPGYP
ncbi:MAG TPA: VOC family protein [Xanthobacteraceae bacterium]|nr:VOC family protein [Xanthobacteraceae bacterium]